MKENKKNKNGNKFQDILDTINENPFSYFLKPLDNVKDFPNKIVSGMEKLLESIERLIFMMHLDSRNQQKCWLEKLFLYPQKLQ